MRRVTVFVDSTVVIYKYMYHRKVAKICLPIFNPTRKITNVVLWKFVHEVIIVVLVQLGPSDVNAV